MYLFGYGSLISAASVSKSLRRSVQPEELLACQLGGYRRDWEIAIPVIFDDEYEANALFLDVQPTADSFVNGVLLQVSADELAILAAREAQYDTIEVTANIRYTENTGAVDPLASQVFTFCGKPQHRTGATAGECVLPARYHRLVTDAVASRGSEFEAEFWASTAPVTAPLREGGYRFSNPAQELATRPS